MSISDGAIANATNFNAAFLSKNDNESYDYDLTLNGNVNFTANTVSTSGTINALDSSKTYVRLTGSGVTINGITAGSNGQYLAISNVTGSSVTLTQASGSASAADRLSLANSVNAYIPNRGGAIFIYDSTSTVWRLLNITTQFPIFQTKTTTYSALTTDDVILVSASGGSWTLSLPTAVGIQGKIYTIKRTDQTLANAVTIDPNGSETIDGASTKKLATQYESYQIISDGSNWQIINHFIDSSWNSYTPTISQASGTIGTNTPEGYWRRVGSSIEVNFKVTFTGTGTWSDPKVLLPSGLSIANTLLLTGPNGYRVIGQCSLEDSGVSNYTGIITWDTSSTRVILYLQNVASTYPVQASITQAAPFTWGSGDGFTGGFSAPITGWEG